MLYRIGTILKRDGWQLPTQGTHVFFLALGEGEFHASYPIIAVVIGKSWTRYEYVLLVNGVLVTECVGHMESGVWKSYPFDGNSFSPDEPIAVM